MSGQRLSATQTEVGKKRKESRDGRQRPLFLEKENDIVVSGKEVGLFPFCSLKEEKSKYVYVPRRSQQEGGV